MEGSQKIDDGDSTTDRISALPDSLIDCILDRLSFADAVKTSVLSTRWRCCWTRVNRIVVDWRCPVSVVEKLTGIIYSILTRHDGPIHEVHLHYHKDAEHICRMPTTVQENRDIHRWMQLRLDNGIYRLIFIVNPICFLSLPSRILNCSTLTHLSLKMCKLGPRQDFMGVSNLVGLRLTSVHISARLLETLISSSALLDNLLLKTLFIDFDGEEGGVIVINAPLIKMLYIDQDNQPIIVGKTLRLTSAHVNFQVEVPTGVDRRTNKLDHFLQMMPRIKRLEINEAAFASLASGGTPMKLPSMLLNLKYLDIICLDVVSLTQMACFFCLLRSSPNLELMNVHVVNYDPLSIADDEELLTAADGFYEAQKNEGISSRLSKAKFTGVVGNECELMLISTFVECCPMLDRVLVMAGSDMDEYTIDWFYDELMTSSPKSANVEIEFQWEWGENYAPPSSRI